MYIKKILTLLVVFMLISWTLSGEIPEESLYENELIAESDVFVNNTNSIIKNISESRTDVTIFPANGNAVDYTLTLKYTDGTPAVGIPITVTSSINDLNSSSWRDRDTFAKRFFSSAPLIIKRINQGIVRLKATMHPTSGETDVNGNFTTRIKNFHICGNQLKPASDLVQIHYQNKAKLLFVKSAMTGLVPLVDNPTNGLTTHGLVGRHLQGPVVTGMKNLGKSWKDVPNKPPGTPNYLTITGASMRWGGLNPPHISHRFGGAIDIRPLGTKSGPIEFGDSYYDRHSTQLLVDALNRMGATAIIFADPNIIGLTKVDSHHKNHLHVSFLKQHNEPWAYDEELDFEGQKFVDYENYNDPAYFNASVNIEESYFDLEYDQ